MQGLLEVATEGYGFLPGQVGLWPAGRSKVQLTFPPPAGHFLGASQRSLVLMVLTVLPRGPGVLQGSPSLTSMDVILGTSISGFLFLSFNSNPE